MSHVAPWVSTTDVGVILGGIVTANVDVVLGDKVFESLVQVLSIGDNFILGLSIISDVNIVGAWCLNLKNLFWVRR